MPRRLRAGHRMTRDRMLAAIPGENQRRAELGIEPVPIEEELLMQGYLSVGVLPDDWRERRNDGRDVRPRFVRELFPTGELIDA